MQEHADHFHPKRSWVRWSSVGSDAEGSLEMFKGQWCRGAAVHQRGYEYQQVAYENYSAVLV